MAEWRPEWIPYDDFIPVGWLLYIEYPGDSVSRTGVGLWLDGGYRGGDSEYGEWNLIRTFAWTPSTEDEEAAWRLGGFAAARALLASRLPL